MALWMVRAGKEGGQEATTIERSVITIGWNELKDLSGIKSKEDLETAFQGVYPDATPNATANMVGQVWSFFTRIQIKDWVILPLKTRSAIAIGEVQSEYQYRTDLGHHVHHTRQVKWFRTELPRTAFDQDLLYSFGAFMTVCKIKRNDAEARVHAIVDGGPATMQLSPGSQEEAEVGEIRAIEFLDVERAAADQIQQVISRRYRGHKLAELVDAVLRARGYVTSVSPPGPDGGTGVYFYRGRYYNPVFQKFISEDPIGMAGGINLYAYAGNDPVDFTDPLGTNTRGGGASWGAIGCRGCRRPLWNL